MKLFRLLLLCVPLFLLAKPPLKKFQGDLRIYFKDPSYQKGRFFTDQGGVVTIGSMRVQAQSICVEETHVDGVTNYKLIAEGDLLLVVKKRFLKARRFEFDLATQEGSLVDPVVMIGPWFFASESMKISPHRTLSMRGLEVTTCTDANPEWKIKIHRASLKDGRELEAEKTTITWEDIPIFWVPYFRFNANFLRKQKESPAKYKFNWTSGQDPMLSFRYALYSSENLSAYGRVDLRWKRGIGGAIETDYAQKGWALYTKNYIAHDTFYNDTNPNVKKTRFRLQGQFKTLEEAKPVSLMIQYDKISDRNLRADFRQDQFELSTFQRTEAIGRYQASHAITNLYLRPRIKNFQGFMEEIPTLSVTTRPYGLAKGLVLHTSQTKISYLDYLYANGVAQTIPAFKSGRFSTVQDLSSSIYAGPIHITPKVGAEVVAYTASPVGDAALQAICRYACGADIAWRGSAGSLIHQFQPYCIFSGLTKPTTPVGSSYIFGIADGFNRINQIRFGVKNQIFAPSTERSLLPRLGLDLYGMHFFGSTPFSVAVPKLFLEALLSYPNLLISANLEWNFQNHTLNHALIRALWTIHKEAAINLEYYHRGRYDWRTIDPMNFIMEVTRPIPELLESPLSDHRNTIVARLMLPVVRNIDMRLSAHIGQGYLGGWAQTGGTQQFYHEEQFDIFATIATTWKARMTFTHTVRDNQVTFGINMIPRG